MPAHALRLPSGASAAKRERAPTSPVARCPQKLYGKGFEPADRVRYKCYINRNLLKNTATLVDACEKILGIPIEVPVACRCHCHRNAQHKYSCERMRAPRQSKPDVQKFHDFDPRTPPGEWTAEMFDCMAALWADPGIQKAL